MTGGQMIVGLTNKEHQSQGLAEDANLTTFEQKFKLSSLETTDKSMASLQNEVNLLTSSYLQISGHEH